MPNGGERALVVHRLPDVLAELVGLLAPARLDIDAVSGAAAAMSLVQANEYAVILAEHDLPAADGAALLDRMTPFCLDAVRVLVVEREEAEADLAARPLGSILRFFARPWERRQIVGFVLEGMKLRRLEKEQRELVRRLGGEYQKLQRREKLLDVVVKERTKELEESYLRLKAAHRQALLGLAEAIEAKDKYTKGHCGRVAAFALELAREVGYTDDLEAIEFASFLHDIGKIGVRDSVLLKPAALDDDEWVHMREHP